MSQRAARAGEVLKASLHVDQGQIGFLFDGSSEQAPDGAVAGTGAPRAGLVHPHGVQQRDPCGSAEPVVGNQLRRTHPAGAGSHHEGAGHERRCVGHGLVETQAEGEVGVGVGVDRKHPLTPP